jgi:hypothetical protein
MTAWKTNKEMGIQEQNKYWRNRLLGSDLGLTGSESCLKAIKTVFLSLLVVR